MMTRTKRNAIPWKRNIAQYLVWLAFLIILALGKVVVTRLDKVEYQQYQLEGTQKDMANENSTNKRQWRKLSEAIERISKVETKQGCMYDDIGRLKGLHLK